MMLQARPPHPQEGIFMKQRKRAVHDWIRNHHRSPGGGGRYDATERSWEPALPLISHLSNHREISVMLEKLLLQQRLINSVSATEDYMKSCPPSKWLPCPTVLNETEPKSAYFQNGFVPNRRMAAPEYIGGQQDYKHFIY